MNQEAIVDVLVRHYPDAQALYLFGSRGTEFERPDSDIDLALLLPPSRAKAEGNLALSDCWSALVKLMDCPVDLVNARKVDTVFQFRIVQTGRVIFIGDRNALDEFEMMTLSSYQKLQEERAAIIAEIVASKRILNV